MRYLKLRKDLPSGSIILDRTERHNALSADLVDELMQAFEDFYSSRSVRAVILTGRGSTFCAGTDLHELHQSLDHRDAPQRCLEDVTRVKALLERMLRFPKPIVAAVNGPALGTGAALMLACDLAVASPAAAVGLPEARRGLVAGLAAPLVAWRADHQRAAQLAFLATAVPAETACAWGLFEEVVSDEVLWARAQQLTEEVAAGAASSHQLAKQLLNESLGEALLTHLTVGAANTAAARSTEAAREGITAFVEKRAPRWP